MRCVSLVLLAALGLAGPGCGAAPTPARRAAPPDVLIVVIDAMRADRPGCYGYGRDTTPALDALAADPDAVLYRRHHVQGAYTKSSVASLFTGLYVFQHGVILFNMPENAERPGYFPAQVLRDGFDTMAERFKRLDYATFAVVKSWHLDPKNGFAQGFDRYVGAWLDGDLNRADETLRLARSSPQPFLGYLHLAGAHHPYEPPARDPAFMQRYGVEAGIRYDEAARVAQGISFNTADIAAAIGEGRVALEPADVEFLNLVYDAELRRADATLERLLRGLKESGRYDDTLLVVTADHGEELYDHGGYAHGHAVWGEIMQVPLVVKFPRGRKPEGLGREVRAATQAIDLLPSLLAWAGGPAASDLPGTDIFARPPRDIAWCETLDEWALVHDGLKLIDGGAKPLLFDNLADPFDAHDLADARPQDVERLRRVAAALRATVALRPSAAPVVESPLAPEVVDALRSLGYVR
jgi:arylsulfatase A-like enzyme